LLVVNEDTPEEVVYMLTKTIYENLPFLNSVHQATKVMSLQKAIDGLPMPLHKGALKYYKEQGLTIPDRLILD
jgi:TRAP transporter TAXI family solute receptor